MAHVLRTKDTGEHTRNFWSNNATANTKALLICSMNTIYKVPGGINVINRENFMYAKMSNVCSRQQIQIRFKFNHDNLNNNH